MPTPIYPPGPTVWIGIPGQNLGGYYGNMGARQAWGPFEWNSAMYIVLEEEHRDSELVQNNLRVFKSADGISYAELDAANRPAYYWAGVVGCHALLPVIYIAYPNNTSWNDSAPELAFTTFDLSTETWGSKVISSVQLNVRGDSLGVVRRSNGNLYFIYERTLAPPVRRAVYTRYNGSTFDLVNQIIDDGGFGGGLGCEPVAVLAGSNDRIHIFYADYNAGDKGQTPYVFHKWLSSADVLSGQTTVCQIALYPESESYYVTDEGVQWFYDDFIMYHTGTPTIWNGKLILPFVTGQKLYIAVSDSETPTTWTQYLVEGVVRPADRFHNALQAVAGSGPFADRLFIFWNSWYQSAYNTGIDQSNTSYVSWSTDLTNWTREAVAHSADYDEGTIWPLHNIQAGWMPMFNTFYVFLDQFECSTTYPTQYFAFEVFTILLNAQLGFNGYIPPPDIGRVVPPGGGGGGGLCVLVPPPGIVADAEMRLEPFEREGT